MAGYCFSLPVKATWPVVAPDRGVPHAQGFLSQGLWWLVKPGREGPAAGPGRSSEAVVLAAGVARCVGRDEQPERGHRTAPGAAGWTTPGWLEAESSVKDDRYGSSEQVPG